jgi:hypothetical protein
MPGVSLKFGDFTQINLINHDFVRSRLRRHIMVH